MCFSFSRIRSVDHSASRNLNSNCMLPTFKYRAVSSYISSSLLNDRYSNVSICFLAVVGVDRPLISFGGSTIPGGGLLTASGRSEATGSSLVAAGAIVDDVFQITRFAAVVGFSHAHGLKVRRK